MVIWRKFLYIFLILTALTGSCLAKANLLTDSPWASFFNNEKVDPATGRLTLPKEGEGYVPTYETIGGEQVIKGIQYTTGAYSEYEYYDGKVYRQSFYDETKKVVLQNYYSYPGSKTIVVTWVDDKRMRQVEFDFKEEDTVEISVYDLQNGFPELFEKRVYRGKNLETVERLQYVGWTDTYFEATDWDQLLLSFYTPTAPELAENGLDAQTIEKEFDGLGRLYKLKAHDTEAIFAYNWLGLPSRLTIKVGGEIQTYQYDYDILGRRILDPNARRVMVTYRYADGKLREITTPNGTVTYQYKDGKLAARTDALGQRTEFSFDEEKLILSATYHDETTVSVRYTADGKRIAMQDAEGETSYEYNELGQLTKLTRKYKSGEEFTIVHEYSPAGWLAKVTTPDGKNNDFTVRENILAEIENLLTEPAWPWLN